MSKNVFKLQDGRKVAQLYDKNRKNLQTLYAFFFLNFVPDSLQSNYENQQKSQIIGVGISVSAVESIQETNYFSCPFIA